MTTIKTYSEKQQHVLDALQQTYPLAFPKDSIKPLAINIHEALFEWAESYPDPQVSPLTVKQTIRRYCSKLRYKKALTVPDAMRIDLQGNPTEAVSEEAIEHAKQYLSDAIIALEKREERKKINKEKAEAAKAKAEVKKKAEAEAKAKAEAEAKAKAKAEARAKPKPKAKAGQQVKTKPATASKPTVIVKKRRSFAPPASK